MENQSNKFHLIAVRVNGKDTVGQRKLIVGKPYYFLDGFTIEGNYIYQYETKGLSTNIYNLFFGDINSKSVTITAIVGENGSGKSTVIEYVIRLINNFAATTFGEKSTNPSYEHLHYIDGMSGELWYMIDEQIFSLKVENRHVELLNYTIANKTDNGCKYVVTGYPLFTNEERIYDDSDELMQPWSHKTNDHKEVYAKHFFYSLISNYSIYAYNQADYASENNSLKKERSARSSGYKINDVYDCNWLSGLFHKNDGYQTPIVLTPFREYGNIDINIEKTLSNERLIGLLLQPDSSYRIINEHLNVKGFEVTKTIRNGAKELRKDFKYKLSDKGYDEIKIDIIDLWMKYLNIEPGDLKDTHFKEEAFDYIAYKTLKIASKYQRYRRIFYNKQHRGMKSKYDQSKLNTLVKNLSEDPSHITRKIRRCWLYLLYDLYKLDNETKTISIYDAATAASDVLNAEAKRVEGNKTMKLCWNKDDLTPPPFCNTKILLEDINNGKEVDFNTLSSGERQQAFTVSAVLYHLSNLESVHLEENSMRIAYSHALVVFEEIELYFHPKLQTQLIKHLLDGIKQMNFEHLSSIHLLFATHSPFVLSDIPSSNIMALTKDNSKAGELKTFGGNVHDILKSSFFMNEGYMGEYAKWIIGYILEKLNQKTSSDKDTVRQLIMLLDEPLIRMPLLNKYYEIYGSNYNELNTDQAK